MTQLDKVFGGLLLVFAVAVGFTFGDILGESGGFQSGILFVQKEAIKQGYGVYDELSGQWRWKTQPEAALSIVENNYKKAAKTVKTENPDLIPFFEQPKLEIKKRKK